MGGQPQCRLAREAGSLGHMNSNGAVVTATDLSRRYGEGEAAVDALRGVSLLSEKASSSQ